VEEDITMATVVAAVEGENFRPTVMTETEDVVEA